MARSPRRGTALAAALVILGLPSHAGAAAQEQATLAFWSAREGGSVWLINEDGSNEKRLTNGSTPAWSPDGGRLAVSRAGSFPLTSEIWVIDTDGSGERQLTSGSSEGSRNAWPTWSPDGRKIAFASYSDPMRVLETGLYFEWDLFVMNSDGSSRTPLTNTPEFEIFPKWSPDGEKFLFESQGDIYVMNADGSDRRRLTSTGTDHTPAWSPDGRRIVFARFGQPPGIYVMGADGSAQKRVYADRAPGLGTAWSPDGSVIAFVSHKHDNQGDIYVMNADGSADKRITHAPGVDREPAFRPVLPPAARCAVAIRGTRGRDLLLGTSAGERIRGLAGADAIRGGGGDDCLFGGLGDDRLSGGAGDDRLVGGPGNDRLTGVSGTNRYIGGPGNDRIDARNGGPEVVRCGAGTDTVRADPTDRLLGCEGRHSRRRRS